MFFFEKKNQKTFIRFVVRRIRRWRQEQPGEGVKVFWFFFSKKNMLPLRLR
jgi:hypothetical protein